MYSIGEYIVHSNHGVCSVYDICRPDFEKDESRLYYVLHPLTGNGNETLFSPVNSKNIFIRRTMTAFEAHELILRMPKITTVHVKNERQRKETYRKVMSEPYPANLVSVIKTVYERKHLLRTKTSHLPEFERKYGDTSKLMLETEIGLALGIPLDKVEEYITNRIGT